MNKILLGAAAIAFAICAALPVQADDFSGWYVGVTGGQASGTTSATTTTTFSPTGYFATSSVPAIDFVGNQHVGSDGGTYGAQLGYNWQSANGVVFGIEGDYSSMNLSGSQSGTGVYPCCAPTSFTITQSVSTRSLSSIRARLGFTSGHTLAYATAGYAQTTFKYNTLFTDTFAPAIETNAQSATRTGLIWGGGAEAKLAPKISFKMEYLHANFGSISGTSTNLTAFNPAIPFPTNVFTHTASLNTDIIRGGFNFKF
ncbi:MAG TPA: outer membrane beta-barrel protein [Candidatus Baltobacteraceae bacterium]|jgi:outer membrane immunogenic protein